jgi:hypothetical protein
MVAAACSTGGGSPRAVDTPPVLPGATTSAAPSTTAAGAATEPAPLTGLPVPPATARRPLLAVAVGSDPAPRGLDRADLVVEELSTPARYVAMFQSRDATQIGPVVPARPVDAQLLGFGRPVLAYDGGPRGVLNQLQRAGVVDLSRSSHADAYQSGADGIYTSTTSLLAEAGTVGPAVPQLTYASSGEPFATKGATAARSVTVTPAGSAAQQWTYVPSGRVWQLGGSPVRVANVIFQEVEYHQIELQKGQGNLVPSAKALGSGKATVLSGSAVVQGQWIRKGAKQPTNYLDAASVPLRLAAGSTWIVLVPAGTPVSVG